MTLRAAPHPAYVLYRLDQQETGFGLAFKKNDLCQGTTLVVPKADASSPGCGPCGQRLKPSFWAAIRGTTEVVP